MGPVPSVSCALYTGRQAVSAHSFYFARVSPERFCAGCRKFNRASIPRIPSLLKPRSTWHSNPGRRGTTTPDLQDSSLKETPQNRPDRLEQSGHRFPNTNEPAQRTSRRQHLCPTIQFPHRGVSAGVARTAFGPDHRATRQTCSIGNCIPSCWPFRDWCMDLVAIFQITRE